MCKSDLFSDHGVDEIVIGTEDNVSFIIQIPCGKVGTRLQKQTRTW